LRTGWPVLDALDYAAEVEDAGGAVLLREQSAESAAKQGGASEVRRAFASPKQKDGGAVGNGIDIGWARGAWVPHEFIVAKRRV
jgi:hypothetical protein